MVSHRQKLPMSKKDRLVLLGLLIPSALFASFDGQLRALLLRQIQSSFHTPIASLGVINIPIQAGQFLGFFIVRLSDRYGRRSLLLWTIAGYAVSTALTATSWNIWSYGAFQALSQVFIGGEFGVAVTLLAESVPDVSRGKYLSLLLMVAPLGAVFAGSLLALGLLDTTLTWRLFYLISLPPLALTVLFRPKLKESPLFLKERDLISSTHAPNTTFREGVFEVLKTRSLRKATLVIGAVSLLQELALTGTIGWWAYYVETQRHIPVATTGILFALAALVAVPGYLLCGFLMDRFGRRPTLLLYLCLGIVGGLGTFLSSTLTVLGLSLFIAAFFGLGVSPVLSAFTAELFPTHLRASASGWVRNLFANSGAVVGPALVGVLASRSSFGLSVSEAAVVVIAISVASIPLAAFSLDETRGVSLESLNP